MIRKLIYLCIFCTLLHYLEKINNVELTQMSIIDLRTCEKIQFAPYKLLSLYRKSISYYILAFDECWRVFSDVTTCRRVLFQKFLNLLNKN